VKTPAVLGIGLATVCLWLGTETLHAQVPMSAGDRVRLTLLDGEIQTGMLAETIGNSVIVVSEQGARHSFVREEIWAAEVLVGQETRFARNFLLGIAGGSSLGALVGFLSEAGCDGGHCLGSMAEGAAVGAVIFGVALGIPVGLVAGLSVRHDLWEAAAGFPNVASRVSVAPRLGSAEKVGVSLYLAW